MIKKLDSYDKIRAGLIDRGVIFAGWISGGEIVYVREVPGLGTNILYRYTVRSKKRHEICRVPGTVTAFRVSGSGGFVAVKRFLQGKDGVPRGGTVICMVDERRLLDIGSGYGFIDFSIHPEGYSLIRETRSGITEYFPRTGHNRTLLARDRYGSDGGAANPTIALLSPGGKSLLLVRGGGGSYEGELVTGDRRARLHGISSGAEVCWLNRATVAYRSGTPGYFSVNLYDVSSGKKSTLLARSYNTNITCSRNAGMLSFLRDQVVMFYIHADGTVQSAGIEGEDVSFSASGKSFTALLYGRLFLVNILELRKNELELRKYWKDMVGEYRRLMSARSDWENQYSLDYIKRKMDLYTLLLSGKL